MTSRATEAAKIFPEDWYEFASEDHFWMMWRRAVLERVLADQNLPLRTPLRVLDIGCGAGTVQRQIEAMTDWVVDGADLNRAALARNAGTRGRVMEYDIFAARPEFVGAYDAVVLFDVLEHIPEDAAFLSAALAHLRPGGQVLINVPALGALFSTYDRAAGHVRRYDRAGLVELVERAGLVVKDVRFWGLSLLPLAALRKALMRHTPPAQVIRQGFQPPGPVSHQILKAIMAAETALIGRPPLGTSLMLVATIPASRAASARLNPPSAL